MPQEIGWRSALPGILEIGKSARQPPTFDEAARRRVVEKRVAEANRFPLWPLLFTVLAFLLPMGWVWAGAVMVFWAFLVHQAVQRPADVRTQLEEETKRLRHEAQSEAEHLREVVAAADKGDPESLRMLFARWLELRLQRAQLSDFRLSVDAQNGWHLDGQAIRRDEIMHVIPRLGRGGRTVNEKRRATDVDEDLAELNAAAVLSALIALFSGPTSQRVTVRVMMLDPSTGRSVPWITLACPISHTQLQRVLTPIGSAAAAIRRLGGDVGRCRNQRITAAAEPPARPAPSAPAPAVPTRSIAVPVARVTASSVESSPYGANAAAVNFHSASPEARITVTPSHAIPTAPDCGGGTSPGPVNAAPTPRNVRGEFSTVARRFAEYPGDPAARFVAFQTYYSTYAQMTSEQLRFYFKWRNAARKGEMLGTDLSYIFVHVYELLHIIGAQSGFDAGEQLEKLWLTNRNAFPTLDSYLVRWTADLYATEQWNGAAIDLIQRAVTMGAACGADEVLLVADRFWANGDYGDMPQAGVALLVGDPRLGDNKFYREHNNGPAGANWVDRAYREALAIADHVCQQTGHRSLREAAIAEVGTRQVSREAFQGAVYDWMRKEIVLGKVPALTSSCTAVQTYRTAVRYAENILRRERNFAGKLRGVTASPELRRALDLHFDAYVRSTRPRARVTIDMAKAKDLARESADVRARLLNGVDDQSGSDESREPEHDQDAPGPSEQEVGAPTASTPPTPPAGSAYLAKGLLTDLAAVQSALGALSTPARALLAALMACDWEAPDDAPALQTAVSGALVGPLVDEINERAVDAVGDVLLVTESDSLVVQEDFRDEVYWVLKGTLDGFGASTGPREPPAQASGTPADLTPTRILWGANTVDADGFGPSELHALAMIAAGGERVAASLSDLAMLCASTPLLLLDRINEAAFASPYGDIVVDVACSPPALIVNARAYVEKLLARVQPLIKTLGADETEDANGAHQHVPLGPD